MKKLFVALVALILLLGCTQPGKKAPEGAPKEDLKGEATAPFCGDGLCNGSETCENCPQDCGPCEIVKGDTDYTPVEPIAVSDKREPLTYLGGMNFYTLNYIPMTREQEINDIYQDNRVLVEAKIRSAQLCERNSALGEKYGIIYGRDAPGFRNDVIEPEDGIYNFNFTDTWMEAASNHGIQFVGTLDYYDRSDWPKDSGTLRPFGTEPPIPEDIESYKRLVEAIVERYDNDGMDDMPGLKVGIEYWEVGNEAGYLSGEDQLTITRASYEAVKKACPSCKLINGGGTDGDIFQCIDLDGKCGWVDFFKLGGGEYIDVFSLHWGMERGTPISHEDRFQFTASLEYLNGIVQQYVGKDIPIWLTEFEVPQDVSEREQKAWVVKRMTQGLAHNVERFYPQLILDREIGGEPDPKLLIDAETETPSSYYYTMVSLEEKIKGFNRIEKISDTQYKFVFDAESLYVLWTENTNTQIPVEIKGTVTLINILDDQESVVDASSITLTSEPILIEA